MYLIILQKNVHSFNIPMQNFPPMNILKSHRHGYKILPYFLLLQRPSELTL